MNKYMYNKIIKYSLLTFFVFYSSVLLSKQVTVDEKFKYKNIGFDIEYLEDKGRHFTIEDISSKLEGAKFKWKKSNAESLSKGFSESVYWVRFTVKNTSKNQINLLLKQDYPLISYINLYIPEQNNKFKIIKTGHSLKFSQRPIEYRTFLFPLKVKANRSKTYYMRYETLVNMSIVLKMYTAEEFRKSEKYETPGIWIFYGILLVMFIYNLFIFIASRDISYLYYILYIFVTAIISMVIDGTAFQYMWPNSPLWALRCIPFVISLITVH